MLRRIAEIDLPTRWARFRLLGFEAAHDAADDKGKRPETALALVLGQLQGSPPIVRIHSQCTTGDVFHSLRCDCHDQLHLALHSIANEGRGILLYEHQEGRGIGLMEKLRAYALQERGLNTVEANLQLGHANDLRDYRMPVEILRFLGVTEVKLMTSNPQKVSAVEQAGIKVLERLSADVGCTPHSAHYIAVKRDLLGHFLRATEYPVSGSSAS